MVEMEENFRSLVPNMKWRDMGSEAQLVLDCGIVLL